LLTATVVARTQHVQAKKQADMNQFRVGHSPLQQVGSAS